MPPVDHPTRSSGGSPARRLPGIFRPPAPGERGPFRGVKLLVYVNDNDATSHPTKAVPRFIARHDPLFSNSEDDVFATDELEALLEFVFGSATLEELAMAAELDDLVAGAPLDFETWSQWVEIRSPLIASLSHATLLRLHEGAVAAQAARAARWSSGHFVDLTDRLADHAAATRETDPHRLARDFVVAEGIRRGGVEVFAAYDVATTQFIGAGTLGLASGLDFSTEVDRRLRDPASAIILHHNHPQGWALSETDLYTLGASAGLSWLIAYDNAGTFSAATLDPALFERAPVPDERGALLERAHESASVAAAMWLVQHNQELGTLGPAQIEHVARECGLRALAAVGAVTYLTSHELGAVNVVEPVAIQYVIDNVGEFDRGRGYGLFQDPRRAPELLSGASGTGEPGALPSRASDAAQFDRLLARLPRGRGAPTETASRGPESPGLSGAGRYRPRLESDGSGRSGILGTALEQVGPAGAEAAAGWANVLADISRIVGQATGGQARVVVAPRLFDSYGNAVSAAYADLRQIRTPDAYYSPGIAGRIIAVALTDGAGRPLSPEAVAQRARHEVIHWLVDHGVIPEEGWACLERLAPIWRAEFAIDELYGDLGYSDAQLNEEAIAEAFSRWASDRLVPESDQASVPFDAQREFYSGVRASVQEQSGPSLDEAIAWFARIEHGLLPALTREPATSPVELVHTALFVDDDMPGSPRDGPRFARRDDKTPDLFGAQPPPTVPQPAAASAGSEDPKAWYRHRESIALAVAEAVRASDGSAPTGSQARDLIAGRFGVSAAIVARAVTGAVQAYTQRPGRELVAALATLDAAYASAANETPHEGIGSDTEQTRLGDAGIPTPDSRTATGTVGHFGEGRGNPGGARPATGHANSVRPADAHTLSGSDQVALGAADSLAFDAFTPAELARLRELLAMVPEAARFAALARIRFQHLPAAAQSTLPDDDRIDLLSAPAASLHGTCAVVTDVAAVNAQDLVVPLLWAAVPSLSEDRFEEAARSLANRGQVIVGAVRQQRLGIPAALLSSAQQELERLAAAMNAETPGARMEAIRASLRNPPPAVHEVAKAHYPAMSPIAAVLAVHSYNARLSGTSFAWLPVRDAMAVDAALASPEILSATFTEATIAQADAALAREGRSAVLSASAMFEAYATGLSDTDRARASAAIAAAHSNLIDLDRHVASRRRMPPGALEEARSLTRLAIVDMDGVRESLSAARDRLESAATAVPAAIGPALVDDTDTTAEIAPLSSQTVIPVEGPTTIAALHEAIKRRHPGMTLGLARWTTPDGKRDHVRIVALGWPPPPSRHSAMVDLPVPDPDAQRAMEAGIRDALQLIVAHADSIGAMVAASPGPEVERNGLRQHWLQDVGFVKNLGASATALTGESMVRFGRYQYQALTVETAPAIAPPTEDETYLAVARFVVRTGLAVPGKIAALFSLPPETVAGYFSRLADAGIVMAAERGGFRGNRDYLPGDALSPPLGLPTGAQLFEVDLLTAAAKPTRYQYAPEGDAAAYRFANGRAALAIEAEQLAAILDGKVLEFRNPGTGTVFSLSADWSRRDARLWVAGSLAETAPGERQVAPAADIRTPPETGTKHIADDTVAWLRLLRLTDEQIQEMAPAQRAAAIEEGQRAAATVIPANSVPVAGRFYYLQLGAKEVRYTLRFHDFDSRQDNHVRTFGEDHDDAVLKSRVFLAAQYDAPGAAILWTGTPPFASDAQEPSYERSSGSGRRLAEAEPGSDPSAQSLNTISDGTGAAIAASGDGILATHGLTVTARRSERGREYWAVGGDLDRHAALLDRLGAATRFRQFGGWTRSFFDADPTARLLAALSGTDGDPIAAAGLTVTARTARGGLRFWSVTGALDEHKEMLDKVDFADTRHWNGVASRACFEVDPTPRLLAILAGHGDPMPPAGYVDPRMTAARAERLLRARRLELDALPSGNGWLITGKTYEARHLLLRAGGRFSQDYGGYMFREDPLLAVGTVLAQPAQRGAASPSESVTQGELDAIERFTALERDRADESALGIPADELVGDETRGLLERGAAFNIPRQVIANQVEDVALAKRAFQTNASLFLVLNAAGTGKTFVLGGIIRELRALGQTDFLYLTRSQDLIEQVQRDLEPYGLEGVRFETYAVLSQGRRTVSAAGAVLLADEAQDLKNIESSRGTAGANLLQEARFVVLASATPFEDPVEARYLSPTGVFDEVGGFDVWALMHGAEARATLVYNARTGGVEPGREIFWPSTATVEQAKAARAWFHRRGLLTQRQMQIDPAMVDVEFHRVDVPAEYVTLYSAVMAAYDDALAPDLDPDGEPTPGAAASEILRHRETTLKRLLEAAKLAALMEMGEAALASGFRFAAFTETRSERALGLWRRIGARADDELYDYPTMAAMMAEWRAERAMARMLREPPPPPPFAEFIVDIAAAFDKHGVRFDLPSPSAAMVERFGADKVGVYTGEVTAAQARRAKDSFLGGKRPMLVLTMAKGGTGLSLHDTVGDKPTLQANLTLPWTATVVDQVSARCARYGLKSKARVAWIFAGNIPWEAERLAPKVGRRMAMMGASVSGIDLPAAQLLTTDFDFTGMVNLKDVTLDEPLPSLAPAPSPDALGGAAPSQPATERPAAADAAPPTDGQHAARGETPAPGGAAGEALAHDFVISSQEDLAPAGQTAKVRANLDALHVLRNLRAEGRRATPDEQAVLARYSGWGHSPQVFDDARPAPWPAFREELQELLSDEEYTSARASTLNAHYTSLTVTRAIWATVLQLGFSGGRVLEPGCGTGNFIGSLPQALRGNTRMVGIEVDPITAAVAEALYPSDEIRHEGFEQTALADSSMDLAVGNVPFGDFIVHDQRHNTGRLTIHNHFIVKSLALAKPGAIVAVVTSAWTLDSRNPAARRAMADTADLLGAVRLPDSAFKENAGTAVVTDILFLRRRLAGEAPLSDAWIASVPVDLSSLERDAPDDAAGLDDPDPSFRSAYYSEHPEHVLGRTVLQTGPYGPRPVVVADDRALADALSVACADIAMRAVAAGRGSTPQASAEKDIRARAPAERSHKPGSFVTTPGGVAVVEHGYLEPVELPSPELREMEALIALRDVTHDILRLQSLNDAQFSSQTDADGHPLPLWADAQEQLARLYDAYVAEYGFINRYTTLPRGTDPETGEEITVRRFPRMGGFREDPDFATVLALEVFDDDQQTAVKAPIFTRRVVNAPRVIRGCDDAQGALLAILEQKGKVDVGAIADLLACDVAMVIQELQGAIFHNPVTQSWETADAYLSGNVRNKLRDAHEAAEVDPRYQGNVEALTRVQPRDLVPSEITARLGASWIPPSDIEEFIAELVTVTDLRVGYAAPIAAWSVKCDTRARRTPAATIEWGTRRRDFFDLVEDALNGRATNVYDLVEGKAVLNPRHSIAARDKRERIETRFSEWIWSDRDRAARLAAVYNERFNSDVLPSFDGSHLTFPGLSTVYNPHQHQRNGVWRIIQTGNTLLVHPVGSGKTLESDMAAMELRRLGLANKPAFAVPNHMLEQFAREFKQAYPGAKLLVVSRDAISPAKRKLFVARCATGDWDAVIMTHQTFEAIPMSAAYQANYIQEQIDELRTAIIEAKADKEGGGRLTVKQLERAAKSLKEKLEHLLKAESKDDGLIFEELGIDLLFVDEIQLFKNLAFVTRRPNVSATSSARAADLFVKTQWLEEKNPGRSIVGLSATPIANRVAEMFVMQRYFDRSGLKAMGIGHFDQWAANFGMDVTAMELAPDGSTYRVNTRFAKYVNVPELLRHFRSFADVLTKDMLALPEPELRGGKPEVIEIQPSEGLKDYIEDIKDRMDKIKQGMVDPSVDNMLKVTGDGRRAALDLRLVGEYQPPGGKADVIPEKVAEVFARTRDLVYPAKGGGTQPRSGALQIVFCDQGTPKTDGRFSVYDAMRERLVALGIPASRIRYIHDYSDDAAKARLFEECRNGLVSVLLGSTEKMGVGTNVQDRLFALHHADCPWRPVDIEQRGGRMKRQGNLHLALGIAVEEYVYGTVGSFDVYSWQTNERKQAFIGQVLTGRLDVREIEEIDGAALTYAEAKAILTGNPLVRERAELDARLATLRRGFRNWEQDQMALHATIRENNFSIARWTEDVRTLAASISLLSPEPKRASGERAPIEVVVQGTVHRAEAAAARALSSEIVALHVSRLAGGQHRKAIVGEFRGLPIALTTGGAHGKAVHVSLEAPFVLDVSTENPREDGKARGRRVVERLAEAVEALPTILQRRQRSIVEAQEDIAAAQAKLGVGYPASEELDRLEERKREIDAQLSVDAPVLGGEGDEDAAEKAAAEEVPPPEDERVDFGAKQRRSYDAGYEKAVTFFSQSSFLREEPAARELGRAADELNRPRALGIVHAVADRGGLRAVHQLAGELATAAQSYSSGFRGKDEAREFVVQVVRHLGYLLDRDPQQALATDADFSLFKDDLRIAVLVDLLAREGRSAPIAAKELILREGFLIEEPGRFIRLVQQIRTAPATSLPGEDRADAAAWRNALLAALPGCAAAAIERYVPDAMLLLEKPGSYAPTTAFTLNSALQRSIYDMLPSDDVRATYDREWKRYNQRQEALHRPYRRQHVETPRVALAGAGLLDEIEAAVAGKSPPAVPDSAPAAPAQPIEMADLAEPLGIERRVARVRELLAANAALLDGGSAFALYRDALDEAGACARYALSFRDIAPEESEQAAMLADVMLDVVGNAAIVAMLDPAERILADQAGLLDAMETSARRHRAGSQGHGDSNSYAQGQ